MKADTERREALGQFLRTRRARIDPQSVGLPSGTRRRTPGLRREELAQLAGVGVAWYTWLEQGRAITVSAQVLESLARVLQLHADEQAHLFALARQQLPPWPHEPAVLISPALRHILNTLVPCPAYVVSPCFNLLAWNSAACQVFSDFSRLTGRQRNLVWWMFTDSSLPHLFVDWEGEAQRTLAMFRANSWRFVDAPWFITLVAELHQISDAFRTWWPRHDVRGFPSGRIDLEHPLVGRLALEPTMLGIATTAEERVVVYTPLPEAETARKLADLTESVYTYQEITSHDR